MAVSVYLRREPDGLRVVGIDREWPGRSLVDPRVVVRPVRNRYVELDADRQRIFDTYARAMNVKLGENLSPEERFRALSLSEQTTFDAITHALLHSTLTDDAGQPLGKALDLVAGLDRIAGEQAGKSGDQQFRIYVTLQPNAGDVLERSREFVRSSREHGLPRGIPALVPSGQRRAERAVLVAEDGLTADIDVDYRTSKAPQSLFNGHLTSSNSDVRSGDNARRHERRWNGFVNWWSDVFGGVRFGEHSDEGGGPFGGAPTRPPSAVPPNRAANASIPDVADAVQEFLTDWIDPAQLSGSRFVLRAGRPSLRGGFDGAESDGLAGAAATGQPAVAGEDGQGVGAADQSEPGHESGDPVVARGADREARVRAGLHHRRSADRAWRDVRMRSDAAEEVRAVVDAAVRHVLRRPAAGGP